MTPSGLPVTSGAEAARRDGSPPRPAPCAPDLGSGPVLGLAGRRPSACGEGLSSDSTLVFSERAHQTSVCPSCILSCSLLRFLSQERRPEGGVPWGDTAALVTMPSIFHSDLQTVARTLAHPWLPLGRWRDWSF